MKTARERDEIYRTITMGLLRDEGLKRVEIMLGGISGGGQDGCVDERIDR